MNQTEILKKCFSFMDLTTLKTEDTPASVKKLVDKVTLLQKEYPAYPLPASV
jgi:deoxyribose-phosphate aldolase